MTDASTEPLDARLADALYTEAMLLADEARSYFEDGARTDRLGLEPLARVGFACESLKVTTRLMHVIAWLLARRAAGSGEEAPASLGGCGRALGEAATSDDELVATLPEAARSLIAASGDLYARIGRLEEGRAFASGPARALMSRLEQSF